MKEKIKNSYFPSFLSGFFGGLIGFVVVTVSSIIFSNYYLIMAYAIIILAGFLLRVSNPIGTWRYELSIVLLVFPLACIALQHL